MSDTVTAAPRRLRSRSGFVLFWALTLLVCWLALRLVLFFGFRSYGTAGESCLAFFDGLWRDSIAAAWLTMPMLFLLLILPERFFLARWGKLFFWVSCLMFWFGQIFLLFVEYYFFEEFRSRFNTVAVDYLQYPKEVSGNIWDSYPVPIVLIVCFALALAWIFAASRWFRGDWGKSFPGGSRLRAWAGVAALAAFLVPVAAIGASLAGVMHAPLHLSRAHISTDRTLNEIADNGALSFMAAALTHHLDYSAFYTTLPRAEAYERARRLLIETNSQFVEPANSIRRQLAGDPGRPRLNVVIFLEESLGSEFWGCLGRTNTLTPEMDKIANEEGLLFTNLYASGNRTVRGMEGVLSSFPPLPGESIVKRDHSDNVETLARVLKRDGYDTVFLYGGRGVFDGMRSYALRNGYDRFVEQKHFEHPTFTTIWGVCDEDLCARAVEEFRELNKAGRPFFGTVLSVSNHKPYTYPKGRIPEDPEERTRENAVKYSDYALGEFFRAARKEPFWTNTIFAVVADHGARVYGSQAIPIHSYEIPLVIAGPAVVPVPRRIGQLGCSLDVGPTILGLIGRPYQTLFFGRDLLRCAPGEGRALLNHNRDIGLLARDRLVVLGLMQGNEFYEGEPKQVEMRLMKQPGEAERELEKDAAALYQVADDLYMHDSYRLDR